MDIYVPMSKIYTQSFMYHMSRSKYGYAYGNLQQWAFISISKNGVILSKYDMYINVQIWHAYQYFNKACAPISKYDMYTDI